MEGVDLFIWVKLLYNLIHCLLQLFHELRTPSIPIIGDVLDQESVLRKKNDVVAMRGLNMTRLSLHRVPLQLPQGSRAGCALKAHTSHCWPSAKKYCADWVQTLHPAQWDSQAAALATWVQQLSCLKSSHDSVYLIGVEIEKYLLINHSFVSTIMS